MKLEHVLAALGCVALYIGICTAMLSFAPPVIAATPERFIVVSQQYVDSGAKVIVLRDGRTKKCYIIYEAGAGAVLDKDVPCG